MTKSNGVIIHTDTLGISLMDDIALCEAVEHRFLTLCKVYLQMRGVALIPPKELNADMLRWRQMRGRHRIGDFRHSMDELKSTQRIAQWTLDVNSKLRNQEHITLEWEH